MAEEEDATTESSEEHEPIEEEDVGDALRRVKIYKLTDSGQWDDNGTGHISFINFEDRAVTLTIICEETQEVLLHHRVEDNISYSRQGETIITFCEETVNIDLALSFQKQAGCDAIWEQIQTIQRSDLLEEETTFEGGEGDSMHSMQDLSHWLDGLPFPTPENMVEIQTKLTEAPRSMKDYVARSMLAEGYLQKIFSIFHESEAQNNEELCKTIFLLFKGVFALNDLTLFEVLFAEDLVLDLIAALEYDPDLPPGTSHHRHREFFRGATFKEVVPFRDETVTEKVHQNYRITYLKDVILLRYLDDHALGTLSSMIFCNNNAIVTRISANTSFLEQLFALLQSVATVKPTTKRDKGPKAKTQDKDKGTSQSKDGAKSDAVDPQASGQMVSEETRNKDSNTNLAAPGSAKQGSPKPQNGAQTPSPAAPTTLVAPDSTMEDGTSNTTPLPRRPVKAGDDTMDSGDAERDTPSNPDTSATSPKVTSEEENSPAESPSDSRKTETVSGSESDGPSESVSKPESESVSERESCESASDQGDTQLAVKGGVPSAAEVEAQKLTSTRKDVFAFLQQLCGLAKSLQVPLREEFYQKLAEHGLFQVIEAALVSTQHRPEFLWLWLCCADVLTTVVSNDPPLLRNYVMARRRAAGKCLLGCIISALVSPNVGTGLVHQLAQIVRIVLDPSTMQDKHAFLDHVYENYMEEVIGVISRPIRPKSKLQAQYHACELLAFCVHQHEAWSRHFVTTHDIFRILRPLMNVTGKPNVVCSVLRFIRTCIALQDQTFVKQVVQQQLMVPIMDLFVANGARYNVLNSSIIELVNFVRQANLRTLVHDLITKHSDKFRHILYVNTFNELKIRWNQNQILLRMESEAAPTKKAVPKPVEVVVEEEDESATHSYFDKDSDEEPESAAESDVSAAESEAYAEEEEVFLQKVSEMQKRRKPDDDDEVDFTKLAGAKKHKKAKTKASVGKASGKAAGKTAGKTGKSKPSKGTKKARTIRLNIGAKAVVSDEEKEVEEEEEDRSKRRKVMTS